MSQDEDIRLLERRVAEDPEDIRSWARLTALRFMAKGWEPLTGPFSWEKAEGCENYSGLSVRLVPPTSHEGPQAFAPEDVAAVIWSGEQIEDYTYFNKFWLVALKDGRFAFVSALQSGTCSHCGSGSDDVAIGSTLEAVLMFGMGDEDRERLAS